MDGPALEKTGLSFYSASKSKNMSTDATSSYVADTGSIEAILILLVFLIAFALILGKL